MARLRSMMPTALDTLADLMANGENGSVRLNAAREILARLVPIHAAADADLLAQLEAAKATLTPFTGPAPKAPETPSEAPQKVAA